jgi:para-aminobenzoate synthetase
MSTLLIDNYDSYTYNVFHLLAAVSGEEPIVVRNDIVSWRALSRWDFDAIVLSPGPGRPERWHDFGVCADILRHSDIPVLGICLGHQGLGHAMKGVVASAPMVMHGRLSAVRHTNINLFAGIPQAFSVVRYHSLAVASNLGDEGRVTAWTDDGVVMGIEHLSRPLWGVQFHPESVATEHGEKLVRNFYQLVAARNRKRTRPHRRTPSLPARPRRTENSESHKKLEVRTRTISGEPSTELLFERLFGAERYAFWLDSAGAPNALAQRSFMGTSAGAQRLVLEYDVDEHVVSSHRADGVTHERTTIFAALARELQARELTRTDAMPPGLVGGFVGYLGYECKADCGSPNVHSSSAADAVMLLANRIVTVDHLAKQTHLIALCQGPDPDAASWLDQTQAVVSETLSASPSTAPGNEARGEHLEDEVVFRCGRGREQYLADIERCKAALAAGESYEICLTDQIHTDAHPDPFELYRILRRSNPAPFAAYLKLGELKVLSTSPERFLSLDTCGNAQTRPIKGTAPSFTDPERDAASLAELTRDEKTFAEHLMIVDLLRNDLGRVCDTGSVAVPELMVTERYATVHQLISTITGKLAPDRTPVDCVHACFPGGSMTGAPKLRTMGIIDDIECEARGVYSGAIGYFSLDGQVDLSIVIRTIVMRPGSTTIGAGGAIVMQSEPDLEFEELLLKAKAPMAAIAMAVRDNSGVPSWSVASQPTVGAAR